MHSSKAYFKTLFSPILVSKNESSIYFFATESLKTSWMRSFAVFGLLIVKAIDLYTTVLPDHSSGTKKSRTVHWSENKIQLRSSESSFNSFRHYCTRDILIKGLYLGNCWWICSWYGKRFNISCRDCHNVLWGPYAGAAAFDKDNITLPLIITPFLFFLSYVCRQPIRARWEQLSRV